MTSNEIAEREESSIELLPPAQPPSLAARQMLLAHAEMMQTAHQLATAMCNTQMVPVRFRGKPDDGAAAILYGAELGLNPIQSLQRVVPIHGMPSLEARTMVGLLKARRYKVKTTSQSDESVTVEGWDLEGEHYTSTWTIERATRAGYVPTIDEKTGKYKLNANGKLIGNEKYLTDPQAMLKAKAQSEVCREMAPDVLLGISYTSEDLESEQWDGTVSVSPPARKSAPVTLDELFAEEVPIPDPEPSTSESDNPAKEFHADVTPEAPAGDVAADQGSAAPDPEPSPAEQPDTVSEPATATSDTGAKPDTEQVAQAAKKVAAKRSTAPAANPDRAKSKMRTALEKRHFTLIGDAGLAADKDRFGRLAVYRTLLDRTDIESADDLDDAALTKISDQLYRWQTDGVLVEEIAAILADAAREAEQTSAAPAADPTSEGTE